MCISLTGKILPSEFHDPDFLARTECPTPLISGVALHPLGEGKYDLTRRDRRAWCPTESALQRVVLHYNERDRVNKGS